jgi:hypothetical protein
MPDRKTIDWEKVEAEYRAGQFSVREIGRQNGVSHVAINKKAKAEGWTRDLAAKVRQEIKNRLVTGPVTNVNTKAAVETAVARGIELVRQHSTILSRTNGIIAKFLDELDAESDHIADIEAEIELETASDRSPQRRNAMLRAISLPSRAATVRELSAAIKNVIPLERQAHNLDTDDGSNDGSTFTFKLTRPNPED